MNWGGLLRVLIASALAMLTAGCVTASHFVSPSFKEEDLFHSGQYSELIRLYQAKYPEPERRARFAATRTQIASHTLTGIVDSVRYEYFLRWYPIALIETGQFDRARIELERGLRETQALLQVSVAVSASAAMSTLRETRSYLRRYLGYLDWLQFGTRSTFVDPMVDPDVRSLSIPHQLPQLVERAFVEDKVFGNYRKALEYLDRVQAMTGDLGLTDLDAKLAYSMQAARRKAWIQMRLGRLSDAKATLVGYEQLASDPMYRAGKVVASRAEYFRGYLSMMDSTAGAVYAASRDFAAAQRYFDAAKESIKEIRPDSSHVWDRNALAAYHVLYGAYFLGLQERYADAAKEIDAGLQYLRPAYVDALTTEIDIESAYLHSAQLHMRAGHADLARSRAVDARNYADRYRSTPTIASANTLLGALLVEQGRPLDALRWLEAAAQATRTIESTDNWAVHHWLGRTYTLLKKDDAALNEYLIAVREVEKLWAGRFDDVPRQLAFMGDRFAAYESAVEALVDRGRAEDAFAMVERSKARAAYESRDAETLAQAIEGGGESRGREKGQPLGFADVKAMLPADTSLLEYYVGTRLVVSFAVSRQKPLLMKRLAITPSVLERRVNEFAVMIQGGPPGRDVPIGRDLYAELVKPLESAVTTPNLGIVPHGALHRLPFHALAVDDSGAGTAARPRYLIDRHAIFYAPSATLLSFSKSREQHARDKLLVLASPPAVEISDAGTVVRMDKLPFAELEAQNVAKLYRTATVFTGAEATETNAKRHVRTHSNVLFAAHARPFAKEPLSSPIVLASDSTNDGRYSVREIESESLSASLIVLSACDSGHVSSYFDVTKKVGAEFSLGDDLVSINRAFLKAGASSVVSSLWPVNDEAANGVIVGFFRRYVGGAPRASALRAAVLDLLNAPNDPERSRPQYWAPFFLTGDWR